MQANNLQTIYGKNKVLIIGLGNLLLGDEGVGIHLIHQLEKEKLPEHIDLLDGGTGGFQLLSFFESYPHIIVVDAAVNGNSEEPEIKITQPKYATDFPVSLSTHELGLKDIIDSLLLRETMPELQLVTVAVNNFSDLNLELSPAVQKIMPELKNRILDLADALLESQLSD